MHGLRTSTRSANVHRIRAQIQRSTTNTNTNPQGLPSRECGLAAISRNKTNERTEKIQTGSNRPNLRLTVRSYAEPLSLSLSHYWAVSTTVTKSSGLAAPFVSPRFRRPVFSPAPMQVRPGITFTVNSYTNNHPQSTPLTHRNQSADDS